MASQMVSSELVVGSIVRLKYKPPNHLLSLTFIVVGLKQDNEGRVSVVWHEGMEAEYSFETRKRTRLFLPDNIEILGVLTIEELLIHHQPACREAGLKLLQERE